MAALHTRVVVNLDGSDVSGYFDNTPNIRTAITDAVEEPTRYLSDLLTITPARKVAIIRKPIWVDALRSLYHLVFSSQH
jgi:hypothetical protein